MDCSALDDDCKSGCATRLDGTCESQPANEGAACDDGTCARSENLRRGRMRCLVDCSSLDDACNVGVCNPTTGDCEIQPLIDGRTATMAMPARRTTPAVRGLRRRCAARLRRRGRVYRRQLRSGQGCLKRPVGDGATPAMTRTCARKPTSAARGSGRAAVDCSSLDDPCHSGVCNPGDGRLPGQAGNRRDEVRRWGPCTETRHLYLGSLRRYGRRLLLVWTTIATRGCATPRSGVCEAHPFIDGRGCEDGDLCTERDLHDRSCAGTAVDCPGWTTIATGGLQSSNGECEGQPTMRGAPATTVTCARSGKPAPRVFAAIQVDCSSLDDQCNAGVCNPGTGACEAQAAQGRNLCEDGDACTADDACQLGACVAGAPPDCDDRNECTERQL